MRDKNHTHVHLSFDIVDDKDIPARAPTPPRAKSPRFEFSAERVTETKKIEKVKCSGCCC